jgi:hypothetical protein
MKRLIAVLAAALLTTAVASAQSYPGDPGVGSQRGVEQLNNSGQVGTVTLYSRPPNTRIAVVIEGTNGRVESVRIYRGPSCDDLATTPIYQLTNLKGGFSSSTVKSPEATLLSGNYNVVLFSSTAPGARAVACGHLYL